MADCTDYPTPEDAKRFKNNAGSVNEFVTSDSDTFVDQDGGEHRTIEGIEQLAENQRDAIADSAETLLTEIDTAASTQRDQFNSTFQAQFAYAKIGNISDYVGDTLTELEKLNSYQYPDDSGEWYGPIQSQTFPITIPADPTVTGSGWVLTTAATQGWVAETVRNPNLLSNHNFLTPSPDDITHPSTTPTDYVAGTQIFSGVFVESDVVGFTYINGRVKWTNPTGAIYLSVPNTNGLEHVTEFTASVADFDGKPRTRGVSFALVGDEYHVTVGIDALSDGVDDTLLGSVKFEQGSVATRHDVVESLTAQTVGGVTNYQAASVADMIAGANITIPVGKTCLVKGTLFLRVSNSNGDITDYKSLNEIYPTAFGATLDGITDDQPFVQECVDSCILLGVNAMRLPDGANMRLESDLNCITTNTHFEIIGGANSKITTVGNSTVKFFASQFKAEGFLASDASFLSYTLEIPNLGTAGVGDVLLLLSDEVAETGWNYTARGAYIITGISGTTVSLDRNLRFNFKVADNARYTILDDYSASVQNIKTVQVGASAGNGSIDFVYMKNISVTNCSSNQDETGSGQEDGFRFVECAFINVDNFHCERLRYPLLVLGGYKSIMTKLTGDSVRPPRHLVDFNSWHEDATVNGFGGVTREGGVNAHPSLNINYTNGSTIDKGALSNMRWWGGSLKNVNITVEPTAGPSGMYSGVTMSSSYQSYYENLEALGLLCDVDNVQINDKRTASSYQGLGFNIGMSGTFKNIKNIGENGSVVYIENRSLNVKLDNISPPEIRNLNSKTTSTLGCEPVNFTRDGVTLNRYNQHTDHANKAYVADYSVGVGYHTCKWGGAVVNNNPTNAENGGNVLDISMLLTNNQFTRTNQQRGVIKLTLNTWAGVCTKTFSYYNQSNIKSAAVFEITSQSSDPTVDMTVTNVRGDEDAQWLTSQSVPIRFDLTITQPDDNRPIFVTYELEGNTLLI